MLITFTPTEKRILHLLSDSEPHVTAEMMECLYDELSTMFALHMAVNRLNKKLIHRRQQVIRQDINNRIYYRHVRLLNAKHLRE